MENVVLKLQQNDRPSVPPGFCKCGCGHKTKVTNRNDYRRGLLKGEPQRFCAGHGRRLYRSPTVVGVLGGKRVAYISLGFKELSTIVDEADLDSISDYPWHAYWDPSVQTFYVSRTYYD